MNSSVAQDLKDQISNLANIFQNTGMNIKRLLTEKISTPALLIIMLLLLLLLLVNKKQVDRTSNVALLKARISGMKYVLSTEYIHQLQHGDNQGLWPVLNENLFSSGKIPSNPFPEPSSKVTVISNDRNIIPDDGENDGGWIYNLKTGELRPDSYLYFQFGY